MSDLQEIHCKKCGKLLLKATGEVKKTCPKCKTDNHFIVSSIGIIDVDKFNNKP